MSVLNWLMNLSFWLQTDGRGDMIFVTLAFALLLEVSVRVIRRFRADRRAKIDAARNNRRVSARLGRAPSA